MLQPLWKVFFLNTHLFFVCLFCFVFWCLFQVFVLAETGLWCGSLTSWTSITPDPISYYISCKVSNTWQSGDRFRPFVSLASCNPFHCLVFILLFCQFWWVNPWSLNVNLYYVEKRGAVLNKNVMSAVVDAMNIIQKLFAFFRLKC